MFMDLVDSKPFLFLMVSGLGKLVLMLSRGVFTDPKLGPVLYYHYVDTRVGYADGQKLFGWNVIRWTGGWPTL